MPPVSESTSRLNDKDRQTLSKLLRMLDSGQGAEISTAVSKIKDILQRHNLSFNDLAENPDNLLEPVNATELLTMRKKYDECIEANVAFVQQNEALRKENERLRLRLSLRERFMARVHLPLSIARFPLYAVTGPVGYFVMEKMGIANQNRTYNSPPTALKYLAATGLCAAFWMGVNLVDSSV